MGDYRISGYYCRRITDFRTPRRYGWAPAYLSGWSGHFCAGVRAVWHGAVALAADRGAALPGPWGCSCIQRQYRHDYKFFPQLRAWIGAGVERGRGIAGCGRWTNDRRHHCAIPELALDFLRQCADLPARIDCRVYRLSGTAASAGRERAL